MIDYVDFGKMASSGAFRRCVALVRHGERPPIDPEDPTFGAALPISVAGRAMALSCGRDLALCGHRAGDWAFVSSPLRRTRLTAAAIAEGMGDDAAEVRESPEVGIPGFWMSDAAEAHRHYETEGSVPFTTRFLDDGKAEGFRPVAESTAMAMEWIGSDPFGKKCALVVTHDVFIAALMRGLGEKRVSCGLWVGYLQGVALFLGPAGAWSSEWLVPDKARWKSEFVQ